MRVAIVRTRGIDPSAMKIAQVLSESGHQVKLLVWDRSNTVRYDSELPYSVFKFGLPAPYDRLSLGFLLPLWWLFELLFLLRTQVDVVHACDLDTLLPAILLRLAKRGRLCYTIFDFYAANLPSKVPEWMRKIVGSVEKTSLRFVDVLFLPDECRYEQVKGARIRDLVYVYNSPPEHPDIGRAPRRSQAKTAVLFYAGILHRSRGVQLVAEAVLGLDNARLVIAGSGSDVASIKGLEKRFPDKIRYLGQLPYRRVLEETADADILFALYDPAVPNNRLASPNKLFEAMLCEKPIIVNSEVAASRIVLEERCGLLVPYGNREAIRGAISKLAADTDLRGRLGRNGRKAYDERYGWGIMKDRLLRAYSQLEPQKVHDA